MVKLNYSFSEMIKEKNMLRAFQVVRTVQALQAINNRGTSRALCHTAVNASTLREMVDNANRDIQLVNKIDKKIQCLIDNGTLKTLAERGHEQYEILYHLDIKHSMPVGKQCQDVESYVQNFIATNPKLSGFKLYPFNYKPTWEPTQQVGIGIKW